MRDWRIMRGRKIDLVSLFDHYQTYLEDEFYVRLVLNGSCISMVDKNGNPFANLFENLLFTVSPTGPDDIVQISSCPTLLETYCEKNGWQFNLNEEGDIIRAFVAAVANCVSDGDVAFARVLEVMLGG